MCAVPISAGEVAWTVADADWERLQVAAAEACAAHDLVGAADSWAAALCAARANFEADDPRLATSLANHAFAMRLGGERVSDRLFAEALQIWDAAPAWLTRQRFAPRSRSSLFHLRLEAKHGGAYDANLRRRAEALLTEARAATAATAAGGPARAPDPAVFRAFRSTPLDPMRKVLAAAHLLAAVPAQRGEYGPAQDGS